MKRILVVEDDENKRKQIVDYLVDTFSPVVVSTARSYQSGLRTLIDFPFDLVILDMTMPTFDIGLNEDGGRPQAYAGRDILRQMDRRDLSSPVLVVTQFDKFGQGTDELSLDELNQQLLAESLPNYKGLVFYDPSTTDWKKGISKLTKQLGILI